jgi:FKBP-type peptidyl-prolyl cis-trans isomerase SlyD
MISDNKVVSMSYTLKDDAGNVLDASDGEPLEYLQGHQNIIPGLEKALVGLKVGDKKHVEVSPAEGYGEVEDDSGITVPRTQFPSSPPPELGMMVALKGQGGQVVQATIIKIDKDEVHLDTNHPLAGKKLFFDVEITGIRDATSEEIAHGHPHGPDGHGHHH